MAAAGREPASESREAALLTALNAAGRPEEVVARFESRQHPAGEPAVVEYLNALLLTGQLARLAVPQGQAATMVAASGAAPELAAVGAASTGASSSSASAGGPALASLLSELRHLRTETGSGASGSGLPGHTPKLPLHVTMVTPPALPWPLRLLQEVARLIAYTLLATLVWQAGFTLWRRYGAATSAAAPGAASAAGGGMGGLNGGGAYAPKEYHKDALPEKGVKTFADVKGCDEAKKEMQDIVEYLKNPSKFTRLGGKLPKGVLLTGPPGTGKTLLAKAAAGEAGVPFFYRAGSEFEEMFVGVGSRRVRALFAAAKKKAPCIVFIDEIDAVGGSRKQWESHTRRTLNQLLVEMDGFEAADGVIVLAATNIPETLDAALTRPGRFDRHVAVLPPDVRGREQILQLYLADKPVSADVDIPTLARATAGFSGADLYNLVNTAAVQAALEDAESITPRVLEFAHDKIRMGGERTSAVLTAEGRKLTAYHEAGHALAAAHTTGALPVYKATIMPRGQALGLVQQLPAKDETSISKQQMLARLDVCMGGRVAEELIFGAEHVTSGARSDLKAATSLARHMVSECGMSDVLGPVFLAASGDGPPSAATTRAVDAEIAVLLRDAYARVTTLLRAHAPELHALAAELLDKETLTGEEIRAVLTAAAAGDAKPAAAARPAAAPAAAAKQPGGAEASTPAVLGEGVAVGLARVEVGRRR